MGGSAGASAGRGTDRRRQRTRVGNDITGGVMVAKVRKAVFPVAGFGTRFLPATKAVPKELLPVVDRPLIQYAVDEALDAGIEQMIFVTVRGKHAIEDYFDHAFEIETDLAAKNKDGILDLLTETRLGPGQAAFVRQQHMAGLG